MASAAGPSPWATRRPPPPAAAAASATPPRRRSSNRPGYHPPHHPHRARRSPVTAAGSRLAGLHTRSGGCCRGWPPAAASDKVGLFIVHAAVQDHCQTGNAGERPSSTLSPPRGPSSRLRGRPCRRALPSRARSLCTPPLHHRSRSGFRRRTGKVQSCRDVDGHDLPTRAWSRTERYF